MSAATQSRRDPFLPVAVVRPSRPGHSGNGIHQICRSHAQSVGQPDDVEQADVAFATLDSADIIPMQFGEFCQALLRQTTLYSQLAYPSAK